MVYLSILDFNAGRVPVPFRSALVPGETAKGMTRNADVKKHVICIEVSV
jgi:hypothetical protein